MEEFIQICRKKGLNVTPQRLAIFKAISGQENHPNPEQIFNTVKKDNPTISFATVYKTLETFEKKGILHLVTPLHETLRYDPVTVPHHHMICVRCKKVVDVMDTSLDNIAISPEILKNNHLVDVSLHIQVICPDCRD